jgi:hypothetical protein
MIWQVAIGMYDSSLKCGCPCHSVCAGAVGGACVAGASALPATAQGTLRTRYLHHTTPDHTHRSSIPQKDLSANFSFNQSQPAINWPIPVLFALSSLWGSGLGDPGVRRRFALRELSRYTETVTRAIDEDEASLTSLFAECADALAISRQVFRVRPISPERPR